MNVKKDYSTLITEKYNQQKQKILKHNKNVQIKRLQNFYLNKLLYPITFSIPECKIVSEIPNKTKLLSSLVPGDLKTYIYNNEMDYYNEYKESFFATTTKKAGWDCLRHYEIIANGCIPYFPNIENCPSNTMSLLPKDLILNGNLLYETNKNKNINDISVETKNKFNKLIEIMLKYLKNNLTTCKISEYILRVTNNKHISNALFLSGNTEPDYLRCLTLHGFKTIYGKHCHDYPIISHLYKIDNIDYSKLYGKGITYTNLLDRNLHDDKCDNTIVNDIINKKYDIVIYGSFHRGTPFIDLVMKYYEKNKIIFLCGEDIGCCQESHVKLLNKGYNVFVRELQEIEL